MKYYFGYGSNMWVEQMQMRCPHSRKIGTARLDAHRWIITTRGYAGIVKSIENYVLGTLYEISPSDEASLDKYEGVSLGHYRKEQHPVCWDDATQTALVYVDPVATEGSPKPEYMARINAGLGDAHLPDDYVARYIRPFILAQNPNRT